ncbi:DinB superfamily protein [Reichenbachiella faecimaris]|uniref:DinB superfamily protein n=1 Tax=Reichenbachiella faecimaris TaxID=692418 RepID=A0A1W2GI41_REIFA|nr:DinB family protein [Reichenbachiella faecimaris]SMD36307.1 DinB superfamily protein [Reichenbachiella faecimaris]
MSKINYLAIILIFSLSQSSFGQMKKSYADEMVNLMISMKQYTLDIANQMPEDKFEYKPSESDELRTFAEHYKHVRNFMSVQLMFLNDIRPDLQTIVPKNTAYEKTVISKARVIKDLSKEFDHVIDFLKNTDDKEMTGTYYFFFEKEPATRTRRLIIQALRDHIYHHRAQTLIYLRENNIAPVAYQRY